MKFIKEQWKIEKRFIGEDFKPSLIACFSAFIALALIAFLACLFFEPAMKMLTDYLTLYFNNINVMDASGNISAPLLFVNNIRAAFISVIMGAIPFLFFTAYALGINSMLIGAMAAYYIDNDISMLTYFAGIAPHGIFELPALIVAFALGIYLCKEVTAMITAKDASTARPMKEILIPITRTFIMIVLPLLLISAVIETYITPLAMNAVM